MVENPAFAEKARARAAHAETLAGAGQRPPGDLAALARVNQRLARGLRGLFEPMLRRTVRIEAEPVANARFDAYRDARGGGLACAVPIAMPPLDGDLVLMLEGGFVSQLVDLYFGGPGAVPATPPAEFSPAAEAMAARLAGDIAGQLRTAWADIAAIDFTAGRPEANPAILAAIEPDERVLVARFVLTIGAARPVALDLIYPVAALKPVAGLLSSRGGRARPAADPAWLGRLARVVMDVPLPVRTVLAEPVVPLSRLLTLRPGDVIPISFGPDIPVLVADSLFARGAVGAANGRAAVRLSRLQNPDCQDPADQHLAHEDQP
ncbi:flagellar motor switch protein FliM [Sphingomonas changnyeongensis]|uniref:Flagellar motor switch protein FliM n=1 Tax=Sphingomonas changnyeongensis TaxID=2698679 RepID=A0A7Z2NVI0_9SPHN|nr:FliM/FliN family flagellar motor switch protein [Sphingomonas changnyeongensis]QHL90174.1 flagellar motor switch protein FliM [Sphingomonas changnyeongensis]